MAHYRWDEDHARDRLQQIVAREHAGAHSIGIIDETSHVKKGEKTPGVKRQWCGTLGKTENCIVTVHLAYAQGDFHCLLDGELFLPECWAAERERCRQAGIPDQVGYRPKWQIALELYERACGNGVQFQWLVSDEGYGGKVPFLRALDTHGQCFVAEVPRTFTGWIDPPQMTDRPWRRRHGRPRKVPRLLAGSKPAQSVEYLLEHHPALRDRPWGPYYIKEGEKGPIVWEAKHTRITVKDENGLPGMRLHLVVARNVLAPEEVKFFVSNAPEETPSETLLLVGFSRWRVERSLEDQKQEVGLDHWEGRRWLGLKRHLILSSISYLFLARVREQLGEINPLLTVCQVHLNIGALIRSWWLIAPRVDNRMSQSEGPARAKKEWSTRLSVRWPAIDSATACESSFTSAGLKFARSTYFARFQHCSQGFNSGA